MTFSVVGRTRCRYAHMVASGNAAEETIRIANEAHADLIVLGSQRSASRTRA